MLARERARMERGTRNLRGFVFRFIFVRMNWRIGRSFILTTKGREGGEYVRIRGNKK
jgi:hypothetical protein